MLGLDLLSSSDLDSDYTGANALIFNATTMINVELLTMGSSTRVKKQATRPNLSFLP